MLKDSLRLEKTSMGLLLRLRNELSGDFSRRAVYRVQTWLNQLPPTSMFDDKVVYKEMLIKNLARQFSNQGGDAELAKEVAEYVLNSGKVENPIKLIEDYLLTAEFLARESRTGSVKHGDRESSEAANG